MMKIKNETIRIVCRECNGTGLYVGMCEKGQSAVICSRCNGRGFQDFTYQLFSGLKIRNDIKRVFQSSFGYVHTDQDFKFDKNTTIHFSQGGIEYEKWLGGKAPPTSQRFILPLYMGQ